MAQAARAIARAGIVAAPAPEMGQVPLALPDGNEGQGAQSRVPLSFQCQRARWTAHDLQRLDIRCTWCKGLHWEAELGSRKAQAGEASFESCCKHGQVRIEPILPLPEPLNTLMNGNNAQSKAFRERLRKWNSIFAFTSILFNKDTRINEIGGNFQLFQIHGSLYHRQGPLVPAGRPVDAQFCQVYICNDPTIGSYNHYHLSPNGIPRGNQRWYGLVYLIQIAGKTRK